MPQGTLFDVGRTTVTAPPEGKQPWEMTRREAEAQPTIATGRRARTAERRAMGVRHRAAVAQALREGKPVPEAVLRDYPDLAAQARKSQAAPPRAKSEPADDPAAEPKRPRRSHDALVADLVAHLQERGNPYVLIDEAKRAIFSDTSVAAFDILIYSNTTPNLLALARTGGHFTQADRDRMAEWEQVFGEDFQAAFVWPEADGRWVMMGLRGWRKSRRPLDEAL